MVLIKQLKVSSSHAAHHFLSTTRRVHSYISDKICYFRRRRVPIATETCPNRHIQSPTTGWVIDEHDIKPNSSASVILAENFPSFSLLPPELRLRIWHFASSTERVVGLLALDREHGFRSGAAPYPPAVLHACHESREVARRIYKPWFWLEGQPKKPIHVNPVNGIVFLRNSRRTATPPNWDWIVGPQSIWRRQLRKLQRVAFMYIHNPMDLNNVTEWFCIRTSGQFRNLQELILLWVLDGAWRSFQGRGAYVISDERDSLCHDCSCSKETRRAAEHSRDRILSMWVADGVWERLGREPPAITIMHCCTQSSKVL